MMKQIISLNVSQCVLCFSFLLNIIPIFFYSFKSNTIPRVVFKSHFHHWISFTLRVAKKRLIPVSFCLWVFYDQEECQKRIRQKERDEIQKWHSEVNNVRNKKIMPGYSFEMSALFHLFVSMWMYVSVWVCASFKEWTDGESFFF